MQSEYRARGGLELLGVRPTRRAECDDGKPPDDEDAECYSVIRARQGCLKTTNDAVHNGYVSG